MFSAVPGLVEAGVRVHGRGNFVVVHRVGMVSEAKLSQFLGQQTLLSLGDLSRLSLPEPVLYPSSLNTAVFTAVFLREPAEKLAPTDFASP